MTLTPTTRTLDAVLRQALGGPGGLRVIAGTYAATQPSDRRYANITINAVTVTVPNLNGVPPGVSGQVAYVLADDTRMWVLGQVTPSQPASSTGLVGAPTPWLTAAIPAGYLEFNGQAIPAATYPKLNALFGANLPDLRGLTMLGANPTYPVATKGGAATVTLTPAQIPAHTHVQTQPTVATGGSQMVGASGGGSGAAANGATQANTPAGGAHENLPPYIAVLWITLAG